MFSFFSQYCLSTTIYWKNMCCVCGKNILYFPFCFRYVCICILEKPFLFMHGNHIVNFVNFIFQTSWQKIQSNLLGGKKIYSTLFTIIFISISSLLAKLWLSIYIFSYLTLAHAIFDRLKNTIPNNRHVIQMLAFFRFSFVCSFAFLLINSTGFIKALVRVMIIGVWWYISQNPISYQIHD